MKHATNNEKTIFSIRNLHCAYQKNGTMGKTVLHIKKLDILRGKITILLGKSGSGKSTILETLGLMNNTIATDRNGIDEKLQLTFSPKKNLHFNIDTLWKNDEQAKLSNIRNEHLSFIFQNTNLMPNFTAYENICITQMLQNVPQAEAVAKAKKMMQQIDLSEVDEQKKAHELSGGQRQRIAFVRAITPHFSVLFGDEPTGNLDEITSDILMNMLTKNIREHNRTAIIVTHNIDLALKYADQIILITKENKFADEKQNVGEILAQNQFQNINRKTKQWQYQEQEKAVNIDDNMLKKRIIQLIGSQKIFKPLTM